MRALYLLLLNRTASTGEVDSWANTLPTGSRAAVAFAFLHSDEYRVNLIDLYYAVLLHRIADPGGFNGWFNSGADASAMRLGFDDSAEFFSNG